MRVKISYPTDDAFAVAACADYCGESDSAEEIALEAMADAAKTFGCEFLYATDYGAIWDCPESDQIRAGKFPGLPTWAEFQILDIDNE